MIVIKRGTTRRPSAPHGTDLGESNRLRSTVENQSASLIGKYLSAGGSRVIFAQLTREALTVPRSLGSSGRVTRPVHCLGAER